jgi:hypothetical protein
MSLPLDLQGRKTWSPSQKWHFGHRKGLSALEKNKNPLPLSVIKSLFFGSYALLVSVYNSSEKVEIACACICSLFFQFFSFVYIETFLLHKNRKANK